MSAGSLGRTIHAAKISGWSYTAAGVTIPIGSGFVDLDGDAFDTLELDTAGFSGARSDPINPDDYPDNYLGGSGILTIPAGLEGLYAIRAVVDLGGFTIGAGAIISWAAGILVDRLPFAWSRPGGPVQLGPQAADYGVPSGGFAEAAATLYLGAGDRVQARASATANTAGGSTNPTAWASLELVRLETP